ncbi:hypothetical protein SUGI_0441870 [Cryptomeria japonica]|nr:hypothetical protein SUGI_0441870 [Cryptomeria japonica]
MIGGGHLPSAECVDAGGIANWEMRIAFAPMQTAELPLSMMVPTAAHTRGGVVESSHRGSQHIQTSKGGRIIRKSEVSHL